MNPLPAVMKIASVVLIKVTPKSPADFNHLIKRISAAFTTFSTYPVLPPDRSTDEYNKGWLDGWHSREIEQENQHLRKEKQRLIEIISSLES